MSEYFWLLPSPHRLLGRPARTASSTRPAVSSRRRVRPSLEPLEDRITPDNTYTPTTFADDPSSGLTLRGAIIAANNDATPGTDTINLAQLGPGTFTLNVSNGTSGHEVLDETGDLNINREDHNLIIEGAVDGNGNPTTIIDQTVEDRVFQILDPANNETVTFRNLIIKGGDAVDDGGVGTPAKSTNAEGGGIWASGGSVVLSNVKLSGDAANAGTGFAALGGGIYVTKAALTVKFSDIEFDGCLGGPGGSSNANGGSALGGGIYGIKTSISISSSNFDNDFVTGGNAEGGTSIGNGGTGGGGAVYSSGSVTLTNCELLNNPVTGGDALNSGGSGGDAIGGSVDSSGVTLNGCTSLGNRLKGGNSKANVGGDAEGGGVFSSGKTILDSSVLSNNTLTGGDGDLSIDIKGSIAGDVGGAAEGGGLCVFSDNSIAITDSKLSGNTLTGGNGELADSSDSISGDIGGEAEGGGVFVGFSATIASSTLANNTLTGGNGSLNSNGTVNGDIGGDAAGGGVCAFSTALTDSTLSGNFLTGGTGAGGPTTPGSAQGGGADLIGEGNTTLVNSTIADNQVTGGSGAPTKFVAGGGGLFFARPPIATLTNVTVVGNQANQPLTGGSTRGGGIDNDGGTVTLVNTLVALNGADLGPDYAGAVTNSDHNLISIQDGSSGFNPLHGDLLGSESQFLNPKTGPLASNGGPTQTIALLAGSPAINAGDNSAISTIATAEGASATGATDQRGQGFARASGGIIDIGAFEAQIQTPRSAPPPVASPPSPAPQPTLHTPSLLAFFDSLLAGVETSNSDGTETVTDSIFGIPLLVASYDSNGDLLSVTIFGINVTFLFESTP
jgi:hypothetical protein